MNEKLNLLIGAVIGASVGYFVGAVAAEVILIKEEQKKAEDSGYSDEISNLEVVESEGEHFQVLERNKNKVKINKEKSAKKNYAQYFKDKGRPDLAKLAAKYNSEEVLVDDMSLSIEETTLDLVGDDFVHQETEPESKPIRIISLAEFANEEIYESLTLSYYDDDVLTDENDNPIDHPERVIGEDALVSFGQGSDDSDVVYVRNDILKGVYEIVRTNKDYVLTEPKQLPSRRAIRKVIKEEKNEEVNDN